ncbi:MAG: hypothetical protein RLZZ272_1092, partial [Actinomycetota bacterium]
MSADDAARERVAHLGPAGTFTETAARLIAGVGPDEDGAVLLVPCVDVVEVLRMVESDEAARGVVPIENTLEGSVTATLDALAFDFDLLIHGELELPAALVAAAPSGTVLADARTVRSHTVALGACRRWLADATPGAERIAASSTARAAQEVAEAGPGHVAIVNELAAERYGLEVLARDVTDRTGNFTRFVVVGDHVPAATGWDKTSIVVFIESNRPGALLQLLQVFAS